MNRDRCAYCGVNRVKDSGRQFFSFPKDPIRCQKWVAACNKPYLIGKSASQLHTSYKLCSYHFLQDDFAKPKLKRLVSTACPNFQDDPQLANTVELNLEEMRKILNAKLEPSCSNYGERNSDSCLELSHGAVNSETSTEDNLPSQLFPLDSPLDCITPRKFRKMKVVMSKTQRIETLCSKLYYLQYMKLNKN